MGPWEGFVSTQSPFPPGEPYCSAQTFSFKGDPFARATVCRHAYPASTCPWAQRGAQKTSSHPMPVIEPTARHVIFR
jgi:hypothetical protein